MIEHKGNVGLKSRDPVPHTPLLEKLRSWSVPAEIALIWALWLLTF